MNRRTALKTMGSALVLLGVSRLASAHEGNTFETVDGVLKIESGPGQLVKSEFAHHHHILEIPLSLLANPPEGGIKLKTGWAKFRNPAASFGKHFHHVPLTQEQLRLVNQGETVIVEDNVKDHKYVLRLA